jgi:hypothetical protein
MQPTFGLPGNGDILPKQVELCRSSSTNFLLSRFSSSWSHLLQETVAFVRPVLAITLAIFMLCSLSVSIPIDRPETGTIIRDMNRNGDGLLVIYNNWTMDTVAVLTDKWDKPKVAVYLRTKDALEVDGIRDGEYSLYFTIGDGWNSSAGDFETVYNHVLFPPMVFETDDTDYTIQEVELQEADATNFVPGRFSFPDISS